VWFGGLRLCLSAFLSETHAHMHTHTLTTTHAHTYTDIHTHTHMRTYIHGMHSRFIQLLRARGGARLCRCAAHCMVRVQV
jgi:hypothetical protein